MTFAHIPSGYVLAYFQEKGLYPKRLSKAFKTRLMYITTLGATFPDVDVLPFLNDGTALLKHRQFVTHTPMIYVIFSIIVYAFAETFPKKMKKTIYYYWYAFISGVFLHLLTDSIIVGIRWLYPVSDTYYSMFGVPFAISDFSSLMREYVLSWYFLPEVVFFFVAVWLFVVKRYGFK